jgi:hypothetical protein
MYTSYMRGTQIFLCSFFGINERHFVRFLTVPDIASYKEALASAYPDDPSLTHSPPPAAQTAAWFNVRVEESFYKKIDALMIDLGSSCNSCKQVEDAEHIYEFSGDEKIILKAVKDFVGKEFDESNGDNGDGGGDGDELITSLKTHTYKHLCTLKPCDEKTSNAEYPPKYTPFILSTSFELECKQQGYVEDPWNDTYPIVWSMDAIKDLIVLMRNMGISQGTTNSHTQAQAEAEAQASKSKFWIVDDVFNVRSQTPSATVNNSDMSLLMDLLGNISSALNADSSPYYNASLKLDDFFMPLINESSMNSTTVPMGVDNIGKQNLFGYLGIYQDICTQATSFHSLPPALSPWTLPPQATLDKQSKTPTSAPASAPPSTISAAAHTSNSGPQVVTFANVLTKRVWCICALSKIQADTILLLPEVKSLVSISVSSYEYGTRLIDHFKEQQETINTKSLKPNHIIKLLEVFQSFTCASESEPQMLEAVPASTLTPTHDPASLEKPENFIAPPTVRSVIEFLVKTKKLVPTTTWTPSSIITDLLLSFIEALGKKNSQIFGHLTCQRNQLSIILSDIVPKKRFVAGQMFQVQPCTPLVMSETVRDLEQKYLMNFKKVGRGSDYLLPLEQVSKYFMPGHSFVVSSNG